MLSAAARALLDDLLRRHQLASEKVEVVSARPLTPEEALGDRPERGDFPLLKGKEKLVEATFRGAKGQAFTDRPGPYSGTLEGVLALPLANNYQRAIFAATINAVLRYLGLVTGTVHCRDAEPGQCAVRMSEYLRQRFGRPRLALIGLQPALLEALAAEFPLRVTDLDPDQVGRIRSGVVVEGADRTGEVLAWAEVVLATGSTAVNGTLPSLLTGKPTLFYGVSIAGLAFLEGYERVCFCAH
ncbi:MAG: Rossmann-like domain-containing protein [Moorellales bacterium]